MPNGKNPYGVSFIQTSTGAMITGEIKRYDTYKQMVEDPAPTRLASVNNASQDHQQYIEHVIDEDYIVPDEHIGGILYQRDFVNGTWILLYTAADLTIPTYVEWERILNVPPWVGGVSNHRVKLVENTFAVPRTTYYSFGNKEDLTAPYRLVLPPTGTDGLKLGDEIVLEQYENVSIVLYEKPDGVEAYEFEETITDVDGKTYFYIYTSPYYTFEVNDQGKPVPGTEKPLTANIYRFIYTETDGGIRVWRPCIVKDNIDPVITHLKQDLVNHESARDPHPIYLKRSEVAQYIPTVPTATQSTYGIVRLASVGDVEAGSTGPIAVTADVLKMYTHIHYSVLGHTHPISDVIGLQAALDQKSNTDHTHKFYELKNIPFEATLTAANQDSVNTIVTPKMLYDQIHGHTHTIPEIMEVVTPDDDDPDDGITPAPVPTGRNLQDALDGKSDVGHTHPVNEVEGFPVVIESLKPILNYWLQPNTTDKYGGYLFLPIAGYDKYLVIQWGRLPSHTEGSTYEMEFHNHNGTILEMSPVFYVGLTTKPDAVSTYCDNMLQLGSVSSTGFSWFCQGFTDSSHNKLTGGYWIAIGLQTDRRVLSFEWGSRDKFKSTVTQALTSNTMLKIAHLSRKTIAKNDAGKAYEYNANFMLTNALESASSSFTMFLNSMDASRHADPCDWFTYGLSSGAVWENSLTMPVRQSDDTTSSSGRIQLALTKGKYDWGNHWDKFRINSGTSFVIVYGYVDIDESQLTPIPSAEGGPARKIPDITLPDISLTGVYHAAFVIQNNTKQDVDSSENVNKNLSVDREVYISEFISSGNSITGFKSVSKRCGTIDTAALKYRVYWTIYGYLEEANNSFIDGAEIISNTKNTSFKYKGGNGTEIGEQDITVKIPFRYMSGSDEVTSVIMWRFGTIEVDEQPTLPKTPKAGTTYTYYLICKDDLPFSSREQVIISDFTCDGRSSTPGQVIAFYEHDHAWPYENGIPVTVVINGASKVSPATKLTWMLMTIV